MDLQWCRTTGPAMVPYSSLADMYGNWHNQKWQNSSTGVVFGRRGPLQAPQGLFTGCLQYLNPYRACKLIMHALKLYGLCTGRQNSYSAARVRASWVDVRFLFKTAREQPIRGPGVWCDWGIKIQKLHTSVCIICIICHLHVTTFPFYANCHVIIYFQVSWTVIAIFLSFLAPWYFSGIFCLICVKD